MVDRRSGGGSEDWSEEEWPAGDWEREEPRARPAAPRPPERARPRPSRAVGEEIDTDLSRVMDDPMFNALPGGVPLSGRARPGLRGPERLSARRERGGMSAGQTVLLLFAIALVAGVSFAAGLVVGASGDRTLLSWIPGFGAAGTETVTAAKPLDAGMAAEAPAEGVITFSEHGRVPPRVEEGAEPLPEEKTPPKAAAKPEGRGDTEAPPEKPEQTEASAESSPKPQAAPSAAPVPEAGRNAAEGAPSDQMTFYDTATGKREAPGLAAERTGTGDSDARADSESAGAAGTNAAPAGEAAAEAPLGADVLARRRAEQTAPPPPEPVARPVEAPAGAGDMNAAPVEGTPSGAEILARRRAETAEGTTGVPAPQDAAPAEEPRATAGTFTVQVATLASGEEARGLVERLAAKGFRARIDTLTGTGGVMLYRVRVGRYGDERAAQQDLDRIKQEPGTTPFIKAE